MKMMKDENSKVFYIPGLTEEKRKEFHDAIAKMLEDNPYSFKPVIYKDDKKKE